MQKAKLGGDEMCLKNTSLVAYAIMSRYRNGCGARYHFIICLYSILYPTDTAKVDVCQPYGEWESSPQRRLQVDESTSTEEYARRISFYPVICFILRTFPSLIILPKTIAIVAELPLSLLQVDRNFISTNSL